MYYPPYRNRGESCGVIWCPSCKFAIRDMDLECISELDMAFELRDGVFVYDKAICRKCFRSYGKKWTDYEDSAWANQDLICLMILGLEPVSMGDDAGSQTVMGSVKTIPDRCPYHLEHLMARKLRKRWLEIGAKKRRMADDEKDCNF